MVNIDVTSGLTAGINAANTAAEGLVQGKQLKFQREMAQQDLELAKRHMTLKEQMAQQEQSVREQLLKDKVEERAGSAAAIDQYFKYRGRQFQYQPPVPTGGDTTFFGDKFRTDRDWSKDEMSKLEEHLTGQRNQILSYANNLSPTAREQFLRSTMPMLMADEEDERKGVMLRRMGKRANELVGSGLLDEEETAIVQQTLELMGGGFEDVNSINETLGHLTETAQKRAKDQKTFEDGAKQYEQWKAMSPDGRDADSINNAYITWMASDNRTVESLTRMLAAAKYKFESDEVTIGRYKLPRSVKPEVFRAVSLKESMIEGRRLAMMDPEIAGMVGQLSKGEGEFDEPMRDRYDSVVMKNQFDEMQRNMMMMGYDVNAQSFDAMYPGFLQQMMKLDEKIGRRSAASKLKALGIEDPNAKIRIPTGPEPKAEEPKKPKSYDDPSRKFAPTHNPYAGGAPGG